MTPRDKKNLITDNVRLVEICLIKVRARYVNRRTSERLPSKPCFYISRTRLEVFPANYLETRSKRRKLQSVEENGKYMHLKSI